MLHRKAASGVNCLIARKALAPAGDRPSGSLDRVIVQLDLAIVGEQN